MGAECPTCHGTGFEIRAREDGVASAVRCDCELRQRGDTLLRSARIPKRYDHCSLDNFEFQKDEHAGRGPFHPSLKRAHKLARDWFEMWPAVQHGLLFHGPPGTGKTHLAVAVARDLIQNKGAKVLFYEQRDLLKALQGTFDAASDQREVEVFGPVLEAEVMILDDLGAGRTTPWARDVMHDIIAHRYNESKPLIMTSNHPLGDEGARSGAVKKPSLDRPLTLKDRLGDALMSRLYEMCRIVEVEGEDYRRGVLHAKHHF